LKFSPVPAANEHPLDLCTHGPRTYKCVSITNQHSPANIAAVKKLIDLASAYYKMMAAKGLGTQANQRVHRYKPKDQKPKFLALIKDHASVSLFKLRGKTEWVQVHVHVYVCGPVVEETLIKKGVPI
jgi:hypothetical protein